MLKLLWRFWTYYITNHSALEILQLVGYRYHWMRERGNKGETSFMSLICSIAVQCVYAGRVLISEKKGEGLGVKSTARTRKRRILVRGI